MHFHCGLGTAVAKWITCCATNREVASSIPDVVSGFFTDIKYFRSLCDPGDNSACNRYEYQEYFLVVRADGRKSENLPSPSAFVTKSGTLNFLEPSGSARTCNGTASYLPFSTVVYSDTS